MTYGVWVSRRAGFGGEPGVDDPGDGVECGEEFDGGGVVPGGGAAGVERAAVQAAEHVEQCGGDG